MNVGQLVLCADRQFLDQELEIIVAGKRHDRTVGIGGTDTERCGQCPAKRTGLTAIDPVARAIDMQELRTGDLAEADSRHIAGIATESLVHLFIDTLRLQRRLVEMCLAQHGALALLALLGPARPVAQLACRLPFGRDVQQQLQRLARIRNDTEIRREYTADLGRLNIDMNELAVLPVGVDIAGMTVRPAVADADDDIGGQQIGVAVAVRGLETAHARHQAMVVRDDTPAHQGRDDRNAGDFGEFDQKVGRIGVDDATPATISGRSASFSMASAFSACARVAAGL